MSRRVKVIENIPTQDEMAAIISDYKRDGARVGWKQQPDGRYRIEVVLEDLPRQETFRSPLSGEELHQA